MESSFKELLLLDLKAPHDKQLYRLKKNELILQPSSTKIAFTHICYDPQDIIDKVILQLLMLQTHRNGSTAIATVTLNFDMAGTDILNLIKALMKVKIFSNRSFRMAHFQVRNGHIADYNKSKESKSLIDQLDKFQREIDGCLKLNRIWKINELVKFKTVNLQSIDGEILISRKYGKRTNQFIIIQMQNDLRLVLMILPRCRDYILTKEEQKQIEELFILRKSTNTPITFSSPLTQIMNTYMIQSKLNLLVSAFPEKEKTIEEALHLPLKMSNIQQEQQIARIVESYNKHKSIQLEFQADKIRKRLKELQQSTKIQEQNMQKLAKVYSRTFAKTFSSLQYLKKKDVTNVKQYIEWLKKQISNREEDIKDQEHQLKQIHHNIITGQERHAFYLGRVQAFKNELMATIKTRASSAIPANRQPIPKSPRQVTEDELLCIYDPQKQLNKYREKKYEQMKQILAQSEEKAYFTRMMGAAKSKCSKIDAGRLQQKYYNLIYE